MLVLDPVFGERRLLSLRDFLMGVAGAPVSWPRRSFRQRWRAANDGIG